MRCTKLGTLILSFALSWPSLALGAGVLTDAAGGFDFTGGGGGGSGTVTSVTASGGVETSTGSPITTTGTIRSNMCVRAVTGTTDTILSTDRNCLITYNNASQVDVTLPQAGTAGFDAGFSFHPVNLGAGDVVITPSTSTIQGAQDLTLATNNGTTIASDGTNYVHNPGSGSTGTTVTLDSAFDNGKEIDGANNLANALRVGDGTTPICLYTDATLGPIIKPCTDANTTTYIWNGFTHRWYDIEGDAVMFTIDPDATGNDKYVWASGYRPVKTLSMPADALYPLGAATLVTDTALVSGGLISPYLTVTLSNSDGFYRYLTMDPKWDGGQVTATVTVVNTNATPANDFVVHVSGACYPAGTAVPTTISTTGEQSVTVDFDASGSCGGSACNQNDPASATSAAITINGTPAGGNYCGFQAQVDATGTTETVTGLKVTQLDIHYNLAKGF